MNGLLPDVISPSHYLKKLGIMPGGGGDAPPATSIAPPVAPILTAATNPKGELELLAIGGFGLLLLLLSGRRKT